MPANHGGSGELGLRCVALLTWLNVNAQMHKLDQSTTYGVAVLYVQESTQYTRVTLAEVPLLC